MRTQHEVGGVVGASVYLRIIQISQWLDNQVPVTLVDSDVVAKLRDEYLATFHAFLVTPWVVGSCCKIF